MPVSTKGWLACLPDLPSRSYRESLTLITPKWLLTPVHLFYVLEQQIEREQFPQELAEKYLEHLKGYLTPKYVEFIGKEIQTAYLESYSEYGQNIFDRYVSYADFWIQDQEYRDPETGQLFDRSALNNELEKKLRSLPVSVIQKTSVMRL